MTTVPEHASRPFDLLIYGASGFTGRLVAEYVFKQYGYLDPTRGSLKWGMVGRNLDKLRQVRSELDIPESVPLMAADVYDLQALDAMARSTKVLMTTVGPYQLYGSPVVAACAQAGTDSVDLCGEPAWMREMIDKYQAQAQKTGARIVFSCGFDSIPFDLGVGFLQRQFQSKFGHSASRVKGRVRKMKGTFSGGTAASLKATMAAAAANPAILELLKNPFSLTPGFAGPAQPHGMKPMLDVSLQSWVAPFVMAPINTRNVHRSNFLLSHTWGQDFVYDEMILTGPGDKGQAIANAIAADRSMGGKDGPKPGEGPSLEERESGFYDLMFLAEIKDSAGATSERMSVTVKGDRDPGYGSTSKMITEAALCLLRDNVPSHGGIWTPGALMGEALTRRLIDHAGLSFEVDL